MKDNIITPYVFFNKVKQKLEDAKHIHLEICDMPEINNLRITGMLKIRVPMDIHYELIHESHVDYVVKQFTDSFDKFIK